jgi:hypothetical protein
MEQMAAKKAAIEALVADVKLKQAGTSAPCLDAAFRRVDARAPRQLVTSSLNFFCCELC